MKETFELVQLYVTNKLEGYLEPIVNDYSINGSIIKVRYSYRLDLDDDYRSYDNYLEIELLDYMTFIFNLSVN